MKIVIVTDAWFPQVNGVVTTLNFLKKELEKQNYQVDIIHPGLFRTSSFSIYPEISLAMNPWKVKNYINEDMDYLHIATEGPLGLFARNFAIRNNIEFTTAIHTKFPEYLKKILYIPLSLTYGYLKWFHGPTHKTLVNTNSQIEELSSIGFKNLVLWSRAIDRNIFYPRTKSSNKEYLLYVGRISKEKNLEDFFNLDTSKQKIVVGSGPMLNEYKKKYTTVEFVGPKFANELAQYYSDASVFVFPSKTDTYGIVMIEALACGTPVAAFPVTGPKDIVINDINGYLHHDLLTAVSLAENMKSKFCEESIESLSWSNVANTFLGTLIPARPKLITT
jgi:glycosyltransferase involved in cell wall biosynthesis